MKKLMEIMQLAKQAKEALGGRYSISVSYQPGLEWFDVTIFEVKNGDHNSITAGKAYLDEEEAEEILEAISHNLRVIAETGSISDYLRRGRPWDHNLNKKVPEEGRGVA